MTADIAIPTSVDDVTTEWLNAALEPHLDAHVVADSSAKPISDPGLLSDIADISLKYDNEDCSLPTRMIAKLAATNPGARDLSVMLNAYDIETGFYRSFSGDDLPIVRCFHARHNPETQDMVILMEHLAPSQSPSWKITPDQVRLAIQQVAILHARWWNDDSLKGLKAVSRLDNRERWQNVAQMAVATGDDIRRHVGDRCDTGIAAMEAYSACFDSVMEHVQQRPFALQHQDYMPKQMFFPHNGEGRFAIIDWQFQHAAPGAWDISRLMSMCLDTDTRHRIETDLINDYLEALVANGVNNYGIEDFNIDHKFGVFLSQLMNFIGVTQNDVALVKRECEQLGLDWKDVWLFRGERMIEELDVVGFFRSL